MIEKVMSDMEEKDELKLDYYNFLEETKRINDGILEEIKEKAIKEGKEKGIKEGIKEGIEKGAEDGSVAEQIANPALRNDEGKLVDEEGTPVTPEFP